MENFIHVMTLPFLACLILAGIHAYLGIHVIERQVIFVDLALAQIAALGASFTLIFGYGMESAQSYWLSLALAVIGAAIFSLTRFKKQRIPQEAIIGITYAVSSAALILVLSQSGEGDEHIKQALVGNILLISPAEVLKISVVYSVIGAFHYLFRKRFILISIEPAAAAEKMNIRFWDFLFYVSFGIVVTSSVKIAGVLLVFSFLVVPAACAVLFFNDVKRRLLFGWAVGFTVSMAGMAISYFLDLPTAASVVCAFGVALVLLASGKAVFFRR
jgi:zinc/manganese transport system permease protein